MRLYCLKVRPEAAGLFFIALPYLCGLFTDLCDHSFFC